MDVAQFMQQNGSKFFSCRYKSNRHEEPTREDLDPGNIAPLQEFIRSYRAFRIKVKIKRLANFLALNDEPYEFARKMLIKKLNSGYYEKHRKKIVRMLNHL
jgi:hypothetical protein